MKFVSTLSEKFIVSIIVVLSFFQVVRPILEPDLGWHIAVGRFVVEQKKLPTMEPFAFSALNHPYIAHSWLQDVFLYLLEDWVGMWGITLWYGVVTVSLSLVLFFLYKSKKVDRLVLLAIPLSIGLMLSFVNVRTHLVTILGLALLLYFDSLQKSLKLSQRTQYFCCYLLFIVWSNLHGGVVLGLGLLCYLLLYRWFQDKSSAQISKSIAFLSLAFLGALTNPYGYKIFLFAVTLGSSSVSQTFNQDWLPLLSTRLPTDSFIPRLLLLVSSFWVLLQTKDRKFQILLIVSGLLTLYSIRWSIVLFVVLLGYGLKVLSVHLKSESHKQYFAVTSLLLALGIPVSTLQTTWCVNTSAQCYADRGGYPYEAVQELKKISESKKIFNHYTWGGYLVWQSPDHTIYIDGRMDNYYGGELLSNFATIESGAVGWTNMFEKVDPELVLLPTNWEIVEKITSSYESEIVSQTDTATLIEVR